MRKIIFAVLCLAYRSHGCQVQTSRAQLQSHPLAESYPRSLAEVSTKGGFQPANALAAILLQLNPASGFKPSGRVDRGAFFRATASVAASTLLPVFPHAAHGAQAGQIAQRLSADSLKVPGAAPPVIFRCQPPTTPGNWELEQTLASFTTPLGVKFAGAAGRPIEEAEASAAQTRAQIGKPVRLQVRYVRDGKGSREDRSFNAQQRFDAFAGRAVIGQSRSCEAAGVSKDASAACTFLEFKKGGISQKSLVNSVSVENPAPDVVLIDEVQRIILAKAPYKDMMDGKIRRFPPITTDQETILRLRQDADSDVLTGNLRLVSYLQPLDPLFFEAGGKAVAISDYTLNLKRVAS